MSGHGGGGGDWRDNPKIIPKPKSVSGNGRGTVSDECNITEDTNLNSVVRAVLATLRVGDRLSVEFEPGPPQRLVAKTADDTVAGSITSPSMLQFISCIQAGVEYEALVLSIRGGQCQVRISVK